MLPVCSSSPRRMRLPSAPSIEQSGKLSAAIELRRRFPGITDNRLARECVRTIAGWRPLRPVKRMPNPRLSDPLLHRLRWPSFPSISLATICRQPRSHIAHPDPVAPVVGIDHVAEPEPFTGSDPLAFLAGIGQRSQVAQ